jgi:ribosomal protein S18 acetylase RimI-like enzyme
LINIAAFAFLVLSLRKLHNTSRIFQTFKSFELQSRHLFCEGEVFPLKFLSCCSHPAVNVNTGRKAPTIRQAEPHDKRVLKDIIDLSFPRFFRFFAVNSLESEEGEVLVSDHEGMVVGFTKIVPFVIDKRKYGCILWLAVHPNQRRKGVASALVSAGFESLKRDGAEAVFASVQRRNTASLKTFARERFTTIGFVGLWQLFRWRILQFYSDIWYAPGERVLIRNQPSSTVTRP